MQTFVISPITVVQPQGHLNATNATEFRSELTAAINANPNSTVLVDMENLDSMDSAGLMALVSAINLAQRQNQRFSLCSLSPSIRIIFELTQLDRVFEIFESRSAFEATLQ
ncbi:anti-anti-sigma factor [[Phormidium ambiguum] IAM M-71]|uniref:Anti-sigma factor antagonist n=1 Tax=[Phormidium ambiguum] IAM M-71 TaxID=454136 RepID=A0A1U7IHD4_9CYAN|nr:STAS domain-containing protein [Phormidium ambiguum]OKH36434.1 anti-anti-sigma factor [Phormidium ambiguum IAM M-71]